MTIFRMCLIFLSLICATVFGFTLISYAVEWFRKRRLSNLGIEKQGQANENYITWFLRNGFPILNKPCKKLLDKSKYLRQNLNNIQTLLQERNFQCSIESVFSALIFLTILLSLILSVLFSSAIAGIASLLCVFVLLFTVSKAMIDKRIMNLRNSIPDTLRSMSICFGAGYTIFQTFSHICAESEGAINAIFSKCTHILQAGGSVSNSLDYLKNVNDVPELSFLAVALEVQHQTGGSIKPVIESVKDMVENKLELMRMLQVQTAQAKLSARIVMVLPFALIAIFSIISPGFLIPFFSSIFGFVLLAIACLMQAGGIILVKKMLNVEI